MKVKKPPRSAAWFLLRMTGPLNGCSVVGDYEEIYLDIQSREGVRSARSWYWSQVYKSIPMFFANLVFGGAAMLKNYFKLAYRNTIRHKRYAFLNILGLSVGLAVSLLIAGYVLHELNFDRMHTNSDNIFRINGLIPFGDRTLHNGVVGGPVGQAVKLSIPEVEDSVRLLRWRRIPVQIGERDFFEEKGFYAEQNVLQMFSIPLVLGDSRSALKEPFTAIIDEALARKYFGEEDPLGKSIRLTMLETHDLLISGVMKSMPSNTVLRTPLIVSFATLEQIRGEGLKTWVSWGNITTFIRLIPEANPQAVETKITDLVRSNLDDDEKDASYYLQPLQQLYISRSSNSISNDLDNSGSLSRLYVFSAVALLILLIAAINFINLSTAKITNRLKEVGVRKTCGARRTHLVNQFLMESMLLTAMAMGMGLILFFVFKPRLELYLGKSLNFAVLSTPWILPSIVGLILVVGFLAGSYPALFLSRFQAAVIFRSSFSGSSSKAGLRRFLVGTQFFIAGTLIVCTLIVFKQVRYSEKKDLGFNKENLITLRIQEASSSQNSDFIKNQILRRTTVRNVAAIDSFPYKQNRNIANMFTEKQTKEDQTMVQSLAADEDFVPLMGLKLLAGRNFEKERISDKDAVLINRTAANRFNLENPIGTFLFRDEKPFQVIGLLDDWNTNSVHSPIFPTVLFLTDSKDADLIMRLPSEKNQEVISQIQEIMAEAAPEQSFNYSYVNDLNLQSYQNERRLASLLISFCLLTVFVACLGIFGLAAYSTEQRTKEIGIRKVLGSSVVKIVLLFAGSYVRWVLVANMIAWPVAYVIVSKWLQTFAFRTNIGVEPFFIAGLITLTVALISVIFQIYRAALSPPVETLRYE